MDGKQIKFQFLLSVNDVPEMRGAFSRFTIESVATRYTIAGGKGIEVAEIVVTAIPGCGATGAGPVVALNVGRRCK